MSRMNDDGDFAAAIAAAADAHGDTARAEAAPSLFGGANYRMLADMPVRLSVEVGQASLRLRDVMALGPGSVVELDRQADALIDVKVNGALIARGEVVATGGRFGIRLIEVVGDEADAADGIERRV